MVTKNLTRTAKMIGDKVLITSSAVDEQTIGEFRELYNMKQSQIGQHKDSIRELNKQAELMKQKLKGKEMHLLQKMKNDVQNLLIKEQIEKRVKDTEKAIVSIEKELSGISKVYEDITKKEMDSRKSK